MGELCLPRASQLAGGAYRSAAHLQRLGSGGKPAGRVLPATQHRQQTAAGLLRARLAHPTMSLFNRLDGFVHQLQSNRDFFADWPQRLCHKIRHRNQLGGSAGQAPTKTRGSHNSSATVDSGACWNGRDFSGYTKPLVQFGQAITSSHPEVPVTKPVPFNTMVLNFVAKLKDIGAQLARKSIRSPSLSLYHTFSADTLTSLARTSSGAAVPPPAAAPQAMEAAQLVAGHEAMGAPNRVEGANQQQQLSAKVRTAGEPAANQQQQPPTVSVVSPSTLSAGLEFLSSVGAADQADDDDDLGAEESAHDESIADAAAATGTVEEEDGESGGSGGSADESSGEESEEDQADPECKKLDCSDLLTDNQTPIPGNSIGGPEMPPQQTSVVILSPPGQRRPSGSTGFEIMETSGAGEPTVTQVTTPRLPMLFPADYPPEQPSIPNELYPYIQVQVVERQSSSAHSATSAPLAASWLFLVHLLFALLFASATTTTRHVTVAGH